MTTRTDLELAARKLAEAEHLLQAVADAQGQASTCLQRVFKEAVKGGLNALQSEAYPVTEHRRQHRVGRPAKIDCDPELQAFILARLDRMTFIQIADDVAKHFPPERRVAKTAINDWWHRSKPRRHPSVIWNRSPGGPG
jgi:hypothetical protein